MNFDDEIKFEIEINLLCGSEVISDTEKLIWIGIPDRQNLLINKKINL